MSAPSGRGRGRGRTPKPEDLREPDQNEVDRIKQESMSSKSESSLESSPEQFDNNATTTGEGKEPPVAQDLKDALHKGVQLKEEPIDDSIVLQKNGKKLDPSVPPFVPASNPSDTASSSTVNGTGAAYMKHADSSSTSTGSHHSTSTSSSNISQLNPDSKEFVPAFIHNGTDFPSHIANGDSSGPADDELDQGWQEVGDILRGFERASPIDQGDQSCGKVLEAGAEILLKAYTYPGSFHEIGKKFEETLKMCKPSKAAVINLAEMFVHWGVHAPEMRYTSCRICQLISDFTPADDEEDVFKFILVDRLRDWNKKVDSSLDTDEQKAIFVNFAGFFAEIYSKIESGGRPVAALGPRVFGYVNKLLDMGNESCVRESCKILKLTGNNLMSVETYPQKIDEITGKLRDLSMDQSLSKTCLQLLLQVQELIGCKWGVAPSPSKVTTTAGEWQATEGSSSSKLNKDAAVFVPSEPMSDPYEFETVYNYKSAEEPVACREDWFDFVGDDDNYDNTEEPDRRLGAESADAEFDGLDPEIELEMEAFIDEIEEHLMLQDFDPEMH